MYRLKKDKFFFKVIIEAGYNYCAPKGRDGPGLPRRWMHSPLPHSAPHRLISLL